MERERVKIIAALLATIVLTFNAIEEEELEQLLKGVSQEEAIGPLPNPTAYMGGDRFDALQGTPKVIGEILRFKRTVKGIGGFK